MKKLILIALAFVTLQAVAQDKRKGERNGKREMVKDLSAEEIATLSTKKLTLALDLSEKQQTEVKEILLVQATTRKQKMEEHEKAKKAEKKPSKEERVKMMNARLDSKIAMKQKMKTILSAEQYKKWEKIEGRRHSQIKGKQHRKGKR